MVKMPAAMVAHCRSYCIGHGCEVCEQLFQLPALQLRVAFKRGIQLVNISLMVFGVMNGHRLSVDVRLERVIFVRKFRKFVFHFFTLSIWYFRFIKYIGMVRILYDRWIMSGNHTHVPAVPADLFVLVESQSYQGRMPSRPCLCVCRGGQVRVPPNPERVAEFPRHV